MNNKQVNPTKEQLAALALYPKGQPVVMVNIIRYKRALDEDGLSGAERYRRYIKNAFPFIQQVGARLLWKGKVAHTVVGAPSEQPDIIFMVEYPTVDRFLEMLANEAYQKITSDRSLALEYGGLLACSVDTPQ